MYLLLLFVVFLGGNAQQTVSPPRPPAGSAGQAPLAGSPEISPTFGGGAPGGASGGAAPSSWFWPSGGTVVCCERWWPGWCGQNFHCESFYPQCNRSPCPQPTSRCVPNCPRGETWVSASQSENFCSGSRPNCNPPGFCICNRGTFRVDGFCQSFCPREGK